MVSSVSVLVTREDQRYDRPCDAAGTEGSAISGDWVDQGDAILSSEKSIKTPINSHYFFFGVKDDLLARPVLFWGTHDAEGS
jgi:hypothetical protein